LAYKDTFCCSDGSCFEKIKNITIKYGLFQNICFVWKKIKQNKGYLMGEEKIKCTSRELLGQRKKKGCGI
jgi:hypothetical protein